MMNLRERAPRGICGLGSFALAAVSILGAPMASRAEPPPLIPREILFGNPEKVQPQLSPDGTRMAWIAPDKKNILQVWVKTIGKDDEKIQDDQKVHLHNHEHFYSAPKSLNPGAAR